ncbi:MULTISPECIES: hypothetical protein [Haloarcula]|nr:MULTISPECIES: hypothetical protein [Haloarcula]
MGRYEHPPRGSDSETSREWGSIQLAYGLSQGARISADGGDDE